MDYHFDKSNKSPTHSEQFNSNVDLHLGFLSLFVFVENYCGINFMILNKKFLILYFNAELI